jgi:lysophospholipase L1-like esterase
LQPRRCAAHAPSFNRRGKFSREDARRAKKAEDPKREGADTFDWAHPNPQGQKKMADRWYEAMKPFLDRMRK